MSHGIICHQRNCSNYAAFRYTWPGQNEAAICLPCGAGLLNLANTMGFPLQMIQLSADDHANRSHSLAEKP